MAHACNAHTSLWETFTPFRQRVLVSKNYFLPCHWKCYVVLFLLEQHVVVLVQCLQHFFFSFSLSLFPSKLMLDMQNFGVALLFIEILTLVFIFLICNFYSWPFYKIMICFEFYPSISICDMLFFLLRSSFF